MERAGAAVREFFASVRPSASFDPHEGKWSMTLAGTPGRELGSALLADVLDGVERAAAKGNVAVAVVTGANRPFYRMGSVLFLGPLPRTDFVAFLERGFAAGRITTAPEAADAILDAAHEVPYNVQALAHACWAACRANLEANGQGVPLPLTPELVSHTRDAEALRLDPLYTHLWGSLPSTQRRALLAILREGGDGLTSTPVARAYGMPVTTMQRALESLETKMIVREEQARGTVRLRLEDPLFAAWIGMVVRP